MVDQVTEQTTQLQRIQALAAERLQANRKVAQTVLDKPQASQASSQPIKLKGTPVPSASLASAPRGSFVDIVV